MSLLVVRAVKDPLQDTGLFKISVEDVKNPASIKVSDAFTIQQTNANNNICTEYRSDIKPITITNTDASILQGLARESISLSNDDYEKASVYKIKFTPYFSPVLSKTMVLLNYPSTITPAQSTLNSGCEVACGSNYSPTGNNMCKKIDGARLFQIKDAIPANWQEECTLTISFINPVDNWGNIGFKLKTYEIDDTKKPPE